MCTGDNIDTATAISLNAGIITQEEIDRDEDSKKILLHDRKRLQRCRWRTCLNARPK